MKYFFLLFLIFVVEAYSACITSGGVYVIVMNGCDVGFSCTGLVTGGCGSHSVSSQLCYGHSTGSAAYCEYGNTRCRVQTAYICDTKNETDSLKCESQGGNWKWTDMGNGVKECKENICDSTFHCISYPYTYCEDVPATSSITCVNGNCYGMGGSKWVSYYDKNCNNECGDIDNNRVSGDTVFVPGGSCDDPLQCDPETHCIDFDNGTYILYKVCLVGREVVGNVDERQTMAQITLSGIGSCKDNGYKSETYPNSGGGNTSNPHHSQADTISSDCTIYGYGCEQYQDTTNYRNGDNVNPNKCWCEPFDGNNSVSYIKCPDGSSRLVYMSCDQWKNYFSSSSTSPPPSSGSAGGGDSSSGSVGTPSSDSNPFKGKYPEYPSDQSSYNKNVQGALSGISDVIISIRNHLSQLKNYIMSTDEFEMDSIQEPNHGEYGSLDSSSQDLGFTFDSLFNKIDTSRKIIDTSSYVAVGTCPIISGQFSLCKKIPFFRGNQDVDMVLDLSNFFGFNLCSIIKAIVLGFTSVVVFILSFRVISRSGM